MHPCDNTYIPSRASRQGSILDVFLINVLLIMSPAEVIKDLSSDHLPIKISLNSYYNNTKFIRYNFCNTNWNQFARFLNRNLNLP